MYNINIFEHIQDMCLLYYNIIQWDSKESQLTYEVRLPLLPIKLQLATLVSRTPLILKTRAVIRQQSSLV